MRDLAALPRAYGIRLEPELLIPFDSIDWLANCGKAPRTSFKFPVTWLATADEAAASVTSQHWQDVCVHARGELTSYLSKRDYQTYGSTWNKLAAAIDRHFSAGVTPRIIKALDEALLPRAFLKQILADITLSVLESAYHKKWKGCPMFFTGILPAYCSGHMPCGWDGDIELWPRGSLLLY